MSDYPGMVCARCHGLGTVRCDVCGATGTIVYHEQVGNTYRVAYRMCPECEGKRAILCPRCGGSGIEPSI